ncbi:MAG: Ku protein [Firmicutes bacterium]|nr:Ku protein [Bacillota bacterium]
MRSIWKGAISFGLVNIPVKLYPATEEKQIKFHFLHDKCQTPIQYQRRCPTCEREVANEEIVRGYEFEKGRHVIISDQDLEEIAPESTRTIDLIDFVNLSEIDPVYYAKSYYLGPGEGGHKAYALLERAMAESGRIAIARFTLRSKESLAVVRVHDGALMLETMFYPDEIRPREQIPDLGPAPSLQEREVEMAVNLVENLTARFEPEKYTSEYRRAVRELIESRITGEEFTAPARPHPEKVVDLMEALRASLEQTEKKRAEEKPTVKKRRESRLTAR